MTCDCCDPTSASPDPVVVRLEAEVEIWKLNVADAQGRIRDLHADNARLRDLLREACGWIARHGELSSDECFQRVSIPTEWYDRSRAALEGKP